MKKATTLFLASSEVETDDEFKIENEPTKDVYKRYQEYCLANNLQPMSNIEFSKQINRILNMQVIVKRIGNKTHRLFASKVKEGESE